jgi:hypothetical protein
MRISSAVPPVVLNWNGQSGRMDSETPGSIGTSPLSLWPALQKSPVPLRTYHSSSTDLCFTA